MNTDSSNIKNPIKTLGFGVILFSLLAVLYVNVQFFYSSNTAFAQNLLSVYFFLLFFTLIVFRLNFPAIFTTLKSAYIYVGIFFLTSIIFLTLPHFPATIVGSVADIIKATASVGFIQSFLASIIETIAFIYPVYRYVRNPILAFVISDLLFMTFHISVIYSAIVTQGIPFFQPIIALLILNSIFQGFFLLGKKEKYGIEAASAVHFSFDLNSFGILPLLFKGIVGG